MTLLWKGLKMKIYSLDKWNHAELDLLFEFADALNKDFSVDIGSNVDYSLAGYLNGEHLDDTCDTCDGAGGEGPNVCRVCGGTGKKETERGDI